MPKVIQMPRRSQPEAQDNIMRTSMILRDVSEESDSLGKIQRWLDLADSALENKSSDKKRSA